MSKKKEIVEGYPFGIYFCTSCRTVLMWYPDSKNHPDMNIFPETIKCPTCSKLIAPTEKLRIVDIWTELVPAFLKVIQSYPFSKAIICDEEHVHFVWQRAQGSKDN